MIDAFSRLCGTGQDITVTGDLSSAWEDMGVLPSSSPNAGAIVQHDLSGNLDSCITIRSAEVARGVVRIQAGAGIVADSEPEAEYQEVLDKLSSLRAALGR